MESKQEYLWTNRQEFPNHNVQQLGDRILPKQTPEEETTAVASLFDRLLERSEAALVKFDDQKRQAEVYALPRDSARLNVSSECVVAMKDYSSSKNYFSYSAHLGHLFGKRGTFLLLSATRDNKKFQYGLEVVRSLWERLDNNTLSNRDKLAFLWKFPKNKLYDSLQLRLYRESRTNYIDFLDRSKAGQRVFGTAEDDVNMLKHSNLLGVSLDIYRQSFGRLILKSGWDYGNRSYFLSGTASVQKSITLASKYEINLSLIGANIIGHNVLKNDLLYRNSQTWPGSLSRNYFSPRVQLAFRQYPYLSYLNLKPYIYAQSWGIFRKVQGKIAARIQCEYGIGLATTTNGRLDFSLFRISGDKVGNMPIGELKFIF